MPSSVVQFQLNRNLELALPSGQTPLTAREGGFHVLYRKERPIFYFLLVEARRTPMLVTVLLLAGVFSLAVYLARRSGTDSWGLTEARPDLVTMGVQIICGDCSGEGRIPAKTYLDRNGSCSRCGGRSYVLAANCALRIQHLTPSRIAQLQKSSDKKVVFLGTNPVAVKEHSRLPC
jgi:hypothetical protein